MARDMMPLPCDMFTPRFTMLNMMPLFAAACLALLFRCRHFPPPIYFAALMPFAATPAALCHVIFALRCLPTLDFELALATPLMRRFQG